MPAACSYDEGYKKCIKNLVEKPLGKRLPKRMGEDNVRMDVGKVGCENCV